MDNPNYKQFAKDKLKEYQLKLDNELRSYLDTTFTDSYTHSSTKAIDTYKDIVLRGGKRLRGAFAFVGHDLLGGRLSDTEITKAAMAIELMHAYLLVVDDATDLSLYRRGELTAHKLLEQYHKDQNLLYDKEHYAKFTAVTAALAGSHQATKLVLELDIDPDIKVKAAHNLNQTIVQTAYGQIHDIYNAHLPFVEEEEVMLVHTYKTAHYTYRNPLHFGAMLANATQDQLDKLTEYAIPGGIAFQLQDDILGVFGDSEVTGKSNTDDLAEGKMTLLVQYTLKHGSAADIKTLKAVLHNPDMTEKQFKDAQQAIINSGAYEYNKNKSLELVKQSKEAMVNNFKEKKDTDAYKFIVGIADYMIDRDI